MDLILYKGRDRDFIIPVFRPNVAGVDVPVDLVVAGTHLKLTGKLAFDDTDGEAIISKADGAGIALNAPVTVERNYATIEFVPADTTNLPDGKLSVLYFDLVLTTTAAGEETIQAGLIKVLPRVLQA